MGGRLSRRSRESIEGGTQQISREEAFLLAAQEGRLDDVRRALDAGDVYMDYQNSFGNTALIYSAICGHLAVAEELIKAGADLERKNNRSVTALFMAAANGRLSIAKALSQAGADPYVTNQNGRNAAHFAKKAPKGKLVVRVLREAEARYAERLAARRRRRRAAAMAAMQAQSQAGGTSMAPLQPPGLPSGLDQLDLSVIPLGGQGHGQGEGEEHDDNERTPLASTASSPSSSPCSSVGVEGQGSRIW